MMSKQIFRIEAGDGSAYQRYGDEKTDRQGREEFKAMLENKSTSEDPEGSGDGPSKVKSVKDGNELQFNFNKIQEATISILKAGLNQLSWEPLLGLLEDLAATGSVSRRKLHDCAKRVVHKILGADLETQVLQQFHPDINKAKVILIESLILSYVEELNPTREAKAKDSDRSTFNTSINATEEKLRKKNDKLEKEKKINRPSYQNTTESFRRKQKCKRPASTRRLAQKQTAKQQTNFANTTKAKIDRIKEDSSTSDQELKRIIWTDLTDNSIIGSDETEKTVHHPDKKSSIKKPNVLRRNRKKVEKSDNWDKIETVTAITTYGKFANPKSQNVYYNTDSIDTVKAKSTKNQAEARVETNTINQIKRTVQNDAKSEIYKSVADKITPVKKEPFTDMKAHSLQSKFVSDNKTIDEKSGINQLAHPTDVSVANETKFHNTVSKASQSVQKNYVSTAIASKKATENECTKYCNRTTNTEIKSSRMQMQQTSSQSSCSSLSTHNTDIKPNSNDSHLIPLRISHDLMNVLKRELALQNSYGCSLDYERVSEENVSLPYTEIENLRCHNIEIIKRLNFISGLTSLILMSSIFMTGLHLYSTLDYAYDRRSKYEFLSDLIYGLFQ